MTRNRIALTVTTLGLSGLLGLTACAAGPAARPDRESAPSARTDGDVDAELLALTAAGVQDDRQAAPEPSGGTGHKAGEGDRANKTGRAGGKGAARKLLRRNTLHGELTVQTGTGARTVVVQRGAVTAVNATTVTVRSTDGFTQVWAFADPLRVRKDRARADKAAVVAGAEVAVAGAEIGDTRTARLIVLG